jgi:hypothetical protein
MGYKRLRSPKDLIGIATWVATPEDAKELANAGGLKHREIKAEEAINRRSGRSSAATNLENGSGQSLVSAPRTVCPLPCRWCPRF